MGFAKIFSITTITGGVAMAAGALAESSLDKAARHRFAPAESGYTTVDDGTKIRVRVAGAPGTGPLVVFEAGLGGNSLDWQWIQSGIAADVQTLAYDRAGIGWSDASTASVDIDAAARRLHQVIASAGAPHGVILVAHSLGGAHALFYHQLFPQDVRGLVLVDPVHPEQMTRLPKVDVDGDRHFFLRIRLASQLARFGLMRVFRLWDSPGVDLGEDAGRESDAILASRRHLKAMAREVAAWDLMLGQMKDALPPAPVPAVILSSSLPATEGTRAFQALHAEMAAMLPGTRHLVVPEADHQGLLRQRTKAAATIEAVRDVLSRTKP
jgi:pimeloyl-ACP methyl ester carboxylesterase